MKKILKAMMVLSIALGTPASSIADVSAWETGEVLKESKSYEIETKLKNASNIENDSMAAGALAEKGTITIEDGQWYLTVTFQTLEMYGLKGNASNIKYYIDDVNSESKDAEILTYRQDNEGKQQVESVKIPVQVDSTGVYINMFVDAMNMSVNAYIDYSGIKDIEISDEQETSETVYELEDGTYEVKSNVLKADSDETSMAAQAVKSALIKSLDNQITVTLQMGSVTVYNQTAFIDKMEVEQADGTYKAATITQRDGQGNVSEVQFTLPKNTELTNVKFYYMGSNRGSQARLSLDLENPTKVIESQFTKNGTYNVNIALWHATQDQASMAASAVDEKAIIVVEDSVAKMYVTTKEMTMGSISAWLEELYIGNQNADYKSNPATAEARNEDGKVTMWSFELPTEEEYIDIVVNPHVAMMGNSDIPARLKVDYSSLIYVSESTDKPQQETVNDDNDPTKEETEENQEINDENSKNNLSSQDNSDQTLTSVNTGDGNHTNLYGGLMMSSLLAMSYFIRRKKCE